VLVSELEPDLAEAFEGFAVVQSRELLEAMKAVGIPPRKIADYGFLDRLHENFAFSFDVDRPPEPFAGPTLMIMGRQDSSCGYYDAWPIQENYSRGTIVVLDRAGHGLMVEQRELFNVIGNEWLDRVEEYAQAKQQASDRPSKPAVRPRDRSHLPL
jgi:pimeloyl-ACP methyl ester carboxylesterase